MSKMRTKKKSIVDRILELGDFLKTPRFAEEIRKEIKDRTGYSFDLQDIRVNLRSLLRREKLKRKKEGTTLYKYHN